MNIFDVVTDKEGDWILNFEQLHVNMALYQQQRPGFFTPFKSSQDFAWTLALPLTAPFALNLVAGLFTVVVSASALAFTGGLFFSACTALCSQQEAAKNLLVYSLVSLAVSVTSTILASLLVTAAVVAACAAGAQLITRSAATLFCNHSKEPHNEQTKDDPIMIEGSAPCYSPSF